MAFSKYVLLPTLRPIVSFCKSCPILSTNCQRCCQTTYFRWFLIGLFHSCGLEVEVKNLQRSEQAHFLAASPLTRAPAPLALNTQTRYGALLVPYTHVYSIILEDVSFFHSGEHFLTFGGTIFCWRDIFFAGATFYCWRDFFFWPDFLLLARYFSR